MKLALPLSILAATSLEAFAFTSGPAFLPSTQHGRVTVSLEASRNKEKIASRSKWAESKGVVAAGEEASAAGLMTNDEGLEFVKLVNGESSSEIYLFGGVVTSYSKDGVEYVAVRPDAKMDGSKPISGGLSHCWPQVSYINYSLLRCK